MNLARKASKARAKAIFAKSKQWQAALHVGLTAKVWTEFLIIFGLVASAGFHLTDRYIPNALIILIISLLVVSSSLLVICSGITWVRDNLITEAEETFMEGLDDDKL